MTYALAVAGACFVLLCGLIGDFIYSRGYAQGWDDSVINEYEKEFD